MRTHCIQGEGVKNWQFLAYVHYGWPLRVKFCGRKFENIKAFLVTSTLSCILNHYYIISENITRHVTHSMCLPIEDIASLNVFKTCLKRYELTHVTGLL